MDIKRKKPRTINLRKKKVTVPSTPIKIHIDNPVMSAPVEKPFEAGNFPCIKCGLKEAIELGRCRACDAEHKKMASRLDATPRQEFEKIPPKLTYRKEVSGGVVVTVSTTEPIR